MSALPAFETLTDFRLRRTGPLRWMWDGYLVREGITVLTSQWKAGKTTLLSLLLSRLAAGGTLAGRRVEAGRAFVVSEETPGLWLDRDRQSPLGDHIRLSCRASGKRLTWEEWRDLVAAARDAIDGPPDLFVVDPLAAFLPGHEWVAADMATFLAPLKELAARGTAVLILHHPKKGTLREGQSARGSGVLAGSADILIEMAAVDRFSEGDRRRRLVAYSRYAATPRRVIVEWSPDGTDYVALGDEADHEFAEHWAVLRGVLREAQDKLTRKQIHAAWPEDHDRPTLPTLTRWLDRTCGAGQVLRQGLGRNKNPYRYWLCDQEERWAADPKWIAPPRSEVEYFNIKVKGEDDE